MRPSLVIASVFVCLLLAGCATSSSEPSGGEPAAAGMGMGGSTEGGAGMLSGAVAASKNASIALGPNASGRRDVTVANVVAPSGAWVVVRSATPPGAVLGKTWVPKGPSSDVAVTLTAADTADVRVALHVDQGVKKAFEFDPTRPEYSLDKPVVVGRRPVESGLALSGFGVEVTPNSVLMLVEDQAVADDTITIRYLLLPMAGWITVNTIENGLPGRRVGLMYRPAGESQQVVVPVEGAAPGDYIVTALADRGRPGVFEFNPADPLASPDQPFKSAGVIVSHRIAIK